MTNISKRPDLTTRELQKYVGENYKAVKQLLEKSGLVVYECEERFSESTIKTPYNVDIRYDSSNNEIIRIWRKS